MHRPQDIEKVLRKFPVEDVWGIGRRSVKKLSQMGVATAWDFTQLREYEVRKGFALPGWRTWKELRGEPCIDFENLIEPRQTICVSRSFAKEITDPAELCSQVATFAEAAVTKLRRQGSLLLEMIPFAMTNRFHENEPQTFASRLTVFPEATDDHAVIIVAAVNAVRAFFNECYGYKKAGVLFTRLVRKDGYTRSLFRDAEEDARQARLSEAIDSVTAVYGPGALRFGVQGDGQIRMARERQSPHYTTLWKDIPKVTIR